MSELHPGGAEPAGVSHDLCVCGKPAAHVNADPDEADWACRVPVVGVSDAPENPELSIPAGVCDEAVEAAREAYRASACALSANGAMRAALEAAVPFLQPTNPQVVASRQAVHQAIADELDGEGVVSYGLAPKLTDRVMDVVRPLPTLDRNRLFNILVEFIMAQPQRADVVEYDGVLDQIMALAGRPLPTREQVDKLVSDWFRATLSPEVRDMLADAVLALMGGAGEEATCTAEHPRGYGRCVFVAGHHYEVGEDWTPHADSRGSSWNSQPPEDSGQ